MGHYGGIRGSCYATSSAGTIFITVYSIWHRCSESTGTGIRNNLKYNYFRTAAPERDWVVEPDFDIATADYSLGDELTFRPPHREYLDAAEMFCWLCGKSAAFEEISGPSWPVVNASFV